MNIGKQRLSTFQIVVLVVFFALFVAWSIAMYKGLNGWAEQRDAHQSVRNIDTSAVAKGTLSDLDKLTVNDNPTPPEKYNRVEQFGPAWKDVDHNGCDTRNDILARDLKTISDRRNACVITAGQLADPYSGSGSTSARRKPQRFRSTMLSPSRTPGSPARTSSPRKIVKLSPTTPTTSWPSTATTTWPRAPRAQTSGCPPTAHTPAPTPLSRCRSRAATLSQ